MEVEGTIGSSREVGRTEGSVGSLFDISEEKEIKQFFDDNGYVAIRDVLTDEECKLTLDEMGSQMQELNTKFDIHNPSTYEEMPVINNFGLSTKRAVFSKQLLENRQNPKIYKAFQILYDFKDNDHILVNHDRYAFYRPTCDEYGNVIKPEWKTGYTYPGSHLDFHPASWLRGKDLIRKREMMDYRTIDDFIGENNLYTEQDGLQLQAVINLIDNVEEDGGFQCQPGFAKNYKAWLKEKNNFESDSASAHGEGESEKSEGKSDIGTSRNEIGIYHFSNSDKISMKYITNPTRIPVPKGAIIIWSQLTGHGSKCNASNRARAIQFIKAFPKRIFSKERLKKRSAAIKKELKKINFIPSKIGRIVFGL